VVAVFWSDSGFQNMKGENRPVESLLTLASVVVVKPSAGISGAAANPFFGCCQLGCCHGSADSDYKK